MLAGHSLKAFAPILVTPSGIMMFFSLAQSSKAFAPILVTPSGIVMLFRLTQSSKAFAPILVTGLPSMVSGMTKSPTAKVSQSVMMTSPPFVVHVISSSGLMTSIINPFQIDPISPKLARKPSCTMTTASSGKPAKALRPTSGAAP